MVFFRKVYYLYSDLEDGSRENVGFVRVQVQNQIVKLFFQAKLPERDWQERLGIYLFRRSVPAVWTKIAVMQAAGREFGCRLAVSAESVEGGTWRFFDYHGIVVTGEETPDTIVYGSFDGGGIPQRREEAAAPVLLYAAESEAAESEAAEASAEETAEPLTASIEEAEEELTASAEATIEPESASAEEAIEPESASEKEMTEPEQKSVSAEEAVEDLPASAPVSSHRKAAFDCGREWRRMTGDLAKINVFPAAECVMLRPFQMTRLPKAYWSLGANSFMLHGYYVYGHTVLLREMEGKSDQVWLCVPGRQTPGEKRLAEQYGFPAFRRRPGQRQMGLPEGYWCREIILEGDSR